MLRKLIKHEFIASYRIYLPSYVAVVLLALLSVTTFRANQSLIGGFFMSLFFLLAGGMAFFTVYNLIVSLGQRVYGKQGYLLFSIPAKTWQIMVAKAVTNLIWIVCTVAITVGSFLMFTSLVISWDVFSSLSEVITEFIGIDPGVWVAMGSLGLVQLIYTIGFFMFLFALLNLVYKGEKKVFIGILLYFAVDYVVTTIISLIFGSTGMFLEGLSDAGAIWGSAAIYLVVSIGLYLLTYFIMDKKMELH